MINEFVDKIMVHDGKWDNYERTQEVEIYLIFIGKFELPQEEPKELTQEELDELEKLRKKREKKGEYNYRYLEKKKASMKKIKLWLCGRRSFKTSPTILFHTNKYVNQ